MANFNTNLVRKRCVLFFSFLAPSNSKYLLKVFRPWRILGELMVITRFSGATITTNYNNNNNKELLMNYY